MSTRHATLLQKWHRIIVNSRYSIKSSCIVFKIANISLHYALYQFSDDVCDLVKIINQAETNRSVIGEKRGLVCLLAKMAGYCQAVFCKVNQRREIIQGIIV